MATATVAVAGAQCGGGGVAADAAPVEAALDVEGDEPEARAFALKLVNELSVPSAGGLTANTIPRLLMSCTEKKMPKCFLTLRTMECRVGLTTVNPDRSAYVLERASTISCRGSVQKED